MLTSHDVWKHVDSLSIFFMKLSSLALLTLSNLNPLSRSLFHYLLRLFFPEDWEWITFALLLFWNFQFFSSSFLLNPLVLRILSSCASWESMEEIYIIWDLIYINILMFSFHPSNLIEVQPNYFGWTENSNLEIISSQNLEGFVF